MKSKRTKTNFADLLYKDRFDTTKKTKKQIQRNSIIEYAGLQKLNEHLTIHNKQIYNAKENTNEDSIIQKYGDILNSLDYSLSIPPRVPYLNVEKSDYKKVELHAFNYWKYINKDFVFERNLEIWRQFWLVCEKSDTICQLVDARCPQVFSNADIEKLYPHKKHVLLCNKSDLVKEHMGEYFYYSTKDEEFKYPLSGSVAFIGYPNVGKSSTINQVLKCKKVRVSSTPGKTRYLQTIQGDEFVLYDCPGLVFPKHSKIELILMGVLNIDQVLDLTKYESEILEFIGPQNIANNYRLKFSPGDDVLHLFSLDKGWIRSRCLKTVVKDYMSGFQ